MLTFWPFCASLALESDVDPLDPRRFGEREGEHPSEESGRDIISLQSPSATRVLALDDDESVGFGRDERG